MERQHELIKSILPCARFTALLAIKFMIADTMLRNQVAPSEEVHTRRIVCFDEIIDSMFSLQFKLNTINILLCVLYSRSRPIRLNI